MKTTNYYDTIIEVSEDSPVKAAEIPQERKRKSIARHQFDLISKNPCQYTSDEIHHNAFGRVVIYAVESDSYQKLVSHKKLMHLKAMRLGRD